MDLDPVLKAEERVYLHDGDRGCWTHANSHKISGTAALSVVATVAMRKCAR